MAETKAMYNSEKCHESLTNALARAMLREAELSHKNPVIMCIGSDRSTGDSLGPYVGYRLQQLGVSLPIYGTLEDPVHAVNLIDRLAQVHPDEYVIAIDASLGNIDQVGNITLGAGPIKPGAAVNKELPTVGSLYITGTVNVGGFMEHLVLQSTRLSLVMNIGEAIAAIVASAADAVYNAGSVRRFEMDWVGQYVS